MQQKDHFAALDGLRGLAAISVLLFHLGHWLGIPGLATNARLAVDLFFCLSGYIVPLAYQQRLERGMSIASFCRVRAVRLWPMILAGTLVSAAYLVARRFLLHDHAIVPGELALATALSVLCLPLLTSSKAIGGPQIFPLNGPQYTLFLELAANLVWSLSPRFRGPRMAVAIVAISFALIAIYGPGGDVQATFWQGFPRVFGSFYTGVLVYYAMRSKAEPIRRAVRRIGSPLAVGTCLLITGVIFYWPTPMPGAINWGWSLLVAPLLVVGGAQVALTNTSRSLALTLGSLSYPVYAMHYPIFVWLNAIYQQVTHHKAPITEALIIAPMVLICSFVLLRYFDEPLRRRLSRPSQGGSIWGQLASDLRTGNQPQPAERRDGAT